MTCDFLLSIAIDSYWRFWAEKVVSISRITWCSFRNILLISTLSIRDSLRSNLTWNLSSWDLRDHFDREWRGCNRFLLDVILLLKRLLPTLNKEGLFLLFLIFNNFLGFAFEDTLWFHGFLLDWLWFTLRF